MTTHQEHLQRLAPLCVALRESLLGAGFKPEQAAEIFRGALTAQCIQCAISVSGAELFTLAQPLAGEAESPKVKRMRLGYCARSGCDSYYYRLSFEDRTAIDWPGLIEGVPVGIPTDMQSQGAGASRTALGTDIFRRARSGRLWVAIGCIFLLLLFRHWHSGGRIPLIREPENFRVDTVPQEQAETAPSR